MALTLNVTDSTTSYDLTINFNGNGSDVLAPPPPPVLDDDTGAFDAALVQFKPDGESDLNDQDNRLLNERYYQRNFSDDTLRKFYIPLNFPSTNQTIKIKPTAMPTNDYSGAHLKLNDADLVLDAEVTIPTDNLRVRPVLEVSRVAQTVWGDATGNGTVDAADLAQIVQYLLDDTTPISAGADATGNGTVDAADLAQLVQYLLDDSTPMGPQT
jgi:hypothetical protein